MNTTQIANEISIDKDGLVAATNELHLHITIGIAISWRVIVRQIQFIAKHKSAKLFLTIFVVSTLWDVQCHELRSNRF